MENASVAPSKKRRPQSADSASWRSVISSDSSYDRKQEVVIESVLNIIKDDVGTQLSHMETQLQPCANQQEEFKTAANQLVGKWEIPYYP